MENSILNFSRKFLLISLLSITTSCEIFTKNSQKVELPIALDYEQDEDIQNLTELDNILIEHNFQGLVSSDNFLDLFYEEKLKSMKAFKGFQNYSLPFELDSLRNTDFFEENKYANQNKTASNSSEELKILARIKTRLELTESQKKLFDLHEKLLTNAIFLTDRTLHNKNSQNGLAYIWGSKDYSSTFKPYNYNTKPNICQEDMYGLDCSGMVYQLLLQSGVNFGANPRNFANAQFLSKSENWKNPGHKQPNISPLPNYFECGDCFEVTNIENPRPNEILSGDIIYFRNSHNKVNHIGICLQYSDLSVENSLIVFESRGNPNKDCSYNKTRGPQRSKVISKRLSNYANYGVIRITAK
tara:strand:- start:985 stop:2055 length:1071 start_codon:yes stop_codon:yes gene_type:complete